MAVGKELVLDLQAQMISFVLYGLGMGALDTQDGAVVGMARVLPDNMHLTDVYDVVLVSH